MTENFEIEDYEDSTTMQKFVVDNPTKADWCIKKIQEHEEEYARLKEIADAEIEDIQCRLKLAEQRKDNKVNALKALLYPFFQSVERKETKTQETYKLLHGTLAYKKPSIKIAQPEDDVLVEYLQKEHPEYVKTVYKPAWGEFKKELTITEDGDVVNGTTGEKVDIVRTEEVPGDFNIKF